jgi:prepilin peptidase CpaA
MNTPLLFGWISLAVATVAAWLDLRRGTIPNTLTLGALAVAPFVHAAYVGLRAHNAHEALVAGGFSVLGAAMCGAVPALLWRLHALGGGDVKLMAAIGAMAGPTLGLESLFYAFVFGAGFVVLRLAWRGTLLRSMTSGIALMVNPLLPKGRRFATRPELLESFRLGPALFAGVGIAVLLHGGLS